jgi:branched-chain amino acid transport system substrate-binding protein
MGGPAINLGSDGPFTETGTGGAGIPVESVLNLWASYVDAHGGICGRQVHMYVDDDGGSPSVAISNIEDLVQNKHVAALVAELTSATLSAQQGYEESNGIPLIGGDVEQGAWNLSPVFFPQAASDPEQLVAFYKAAQSFPSGNKVAFLYCIEVAACSAAFNYQMNDHIPQAAGSTVVYSKEVSLTQISFAAECQAAKAAGAGAILTAGDASFTERIANSCGQQGITMVYMAPGAAASGDMVQNQYMNNHTVTTTTVQPWMVSSTPGSAFFAQLMNAYNVQRNGFSSLAFVSVLLAQQVLTLIGSGPVTTQTVLETLRTKIHGFTAGGMTGPLYFHSGAQTQMTCTGLAEIQNSTWVGANNGALTCRHGAPLPLQNS